MPADRDRHSPHRPPPICVPMPPRPWIVAPSMLARGRRPASHDPATCWLCTLDPVPPHGPGHGRPSRWTERAEVAVLAVGVAAVAWLVAAIAWGVGWEASGR